MKDVCHSPLFFMSLIIRFISSPLPSGRLKAFFTGLWGFKSNKAKDGDTQTHTRTHEGTAELSLVRGKCNHKGLIIQTQNTHTRTYTPEHTEPGALSLAGHCIVGLCGQSLHEWLSSVFLNQVFDDECVWSSSECAALSTTACDMCERAREGVYFGCLSVYSHTLLCATYMRTSKCFELLWWAPVDCVSLLTRLPTAAPACEKLLLGPFNGETLVWEKVAKSWEKRALSRRGREGVNHERTCLWLHTHSCSARARTHKRMG